MYYFLIRVVSSVFDFFYFLIWEFIYFLIWKDLQVIFDNWKVIHCIIIRAKGYDNVSWFRMSSLNYFSWFFIKFWDTSNKFFRRKWGFCPDRECQHKRWITFFDKKWVIEWNAPFIQKYQCLLNYRRNKIQKTNIKNIYNNIFLIINKRFIDMIIYLCI